MTDQQALFTEGHQLLPPTLGKEDILGRGASGTVVKVYVSDPGGFTQLQAGQYIAAKKIDVSGLNAGGGGSDDDDSTEKNIRREIAMMKTLRHRNIVEYYGTHVSSDRILHIYLEYCEGNSIRHVYRKNGALSAAVVQSYTYQLLEGLKFLHERGIVHRDIKGPNVLLSRNGDCKLADFGSAINLASQKEKRFTSVEGTVYWMAPEVLQIGSVEDDSGASFPADIWSVGCTVLEMVTGKPPFSHCPGDVQLLKHVLQGAEEDLILPEVAQTLSPELLAFVKRCLKKDPRARPSAAELQLDRFFAPFLERQRQKTQEDLGGSGSPSGPFSPTPGSPVPTTQQNRSSGSSGQQLQQQRQQQMSMASLKPKLRPALDWWLQATNGGGGIQAGDLFKNHFKCSCLLPDLLPIILYPNKVPSSQAMTTNPSLSLEDTLVQTEDFIRFIEWFGPLRTFLSDCATIERQQAQAGTAGGGSPRSPRDGDGRRSPLYAQYGGYGTYGGDDAAHMLLTLKTRSKWFQPLLSGEEAESEMKRMEPESFVIRFSSKYAQNPGSFTLSIKGKGGVNHYRILRPDDGESWTFVLIVEKPVDKTKKQSTGPPGLVSNIPVRDQEYFDSLEELENYGKRTGIPSQRHPDRKYKLMYPLRQQ